jgi:hypothetical protein
MKILFSLLLIFYAGQNAYANVTATVDRNQIVIGETFNLVISIDENSNAQPDLSELGDVFQVLGTSQSSSTRIMNGQSSFEKSWVVSLMANGVGKNTIPPIKVGSDTTPAIQITVSKSDPNAKANGDTFIEIEVDKNRAYVKEQIILTVKLFYAIGLSEGSLADPYAANTIITQLDKGANYSTRRNGRSYSVIERHYALFAEKSGSLELNPLIFTGRDNSSRRSFSMFSTGKPVRAISRPLSLEIKPIPQASIGKDWIPASKVQVSQQWSKQPFKVGEPITRTIRLYVEGLSETQIPDIDLGEIEDVKIYPEQPQTQTETTPQTVKAWKQVNLALIPTHAGAINIPEYNLEWFNTKTGKTELAKLPPLTIQVEAGDFAVEKPAIENLIKLPKQSKQTAVKEAKAVPKTEIKIVEKDASLWKTLTAIFALLWVLTAILYVKKRAVKSSNKKIEEIPAVSKKQIIQAINNRDLQALQSVLIKWWNQQYPDAQVTNLGQMKVMLKPDMQALIDNIELQLYQHQGTPEFDQQQWLKLVKAQGLKWVKHKQMNNTSDLPALY